MQKFVWVNCDVTITDIGTGVGEVRVSLPVTSEAVNTFLNGGEGAGPGYVLHVCITPSAPTYAAIMKYDNSTAAASGRRFIFNGWYEAAAAQ